MRPRSKGSLRSKQVIALSRWDNLIHQFQAYARRWGDQVYSLRKWFLRRPRYVSYPYSAILFTHIDRIRAPCRCLDPRPFVSGRSARPTCWHLSSLYSGREECYKSAAAVQGEKLTATNWHSSHNDVCSTFRMSPNGRHWIVGRKRMLTHTVRTTCKPCKLFL